MTRRKSPQERSNREQPVYDDIPITWDGQTRGPELPPDYNWCERTRKWWTMIRNSAQAMAFLDSDWEVMLETALLHHKLWGKSQQIDNNGNVVLVGVKPNEATSLASEIRRRTESYGFTWADRRKYGIQIANDDQATQEAEQVTRSSAIDYRKRLNGLA